MPPVTVRTAAELVTLPLYIAGAFQREISPQIQVLSTMVLLVSGQTSAAQAYFEDAGGWLMQSGAADIGNRGETHQRRRLRQPLVTQAQAGNQTQIAAGRIAADHNLLGLVA